MPPACGAAVQTKAESCVDAWCCVDAMHGGNENAICGHCRANHDPAMIHHYHSAWTEASREIQFSDVVGRWLREDALVSHNHPANMMPSLNMVPSEWPSSCSCAPMILAAVA